MSFKGHYDLAVWQKAMDFVVACYKACERFPKTEVYGLCSQLQRSAVSVPANIAEGQGRDSTREFLRHLSIAYGSLTEAETHILIAKRLGYVDAAHVETLQAQSDEIGRMLNGLMASLRRKLRPEATPD